MAILLLGFWLILNGRADLDVLVTGAVVSAGALWFAWKFGGWSLTKERAALRLLPGALAYVFFLIIEIFKANFGVIRLVLGGRPTPCVRSFRTRLQTRAARVALANSITLTPGTATIQLVGDRLTVHCLCREMAEGLTDSGLEKRLLDMEAKAHAKRV